MRRSRKEDRTMLPAITGRAADFPDGIEPRDRRLAALVTARLRRSGYPFLWSVKCDAHEGIVILTGAVPTFHLKQIAQELAIHTLGVRQIRNRLHVTSAVGRRGRSAAAG
jgi:osmotically-inducible protein OsmY